MVEAAVEDNPDFNKGKGRTLAGMLLIAAVAIGAFVFYLISDQPNPYGELGKQINGLRGKHFDHFMVCALPGARMDLIKNDGDLRDALHERARAGGQRYAKRLREKCTPQLGELAPQLHALIPPEDADPVVKHMADSVEELRRATLSYSDYLVALEGPYDAEAAEDELEALARAWYDFRKTHAELNQQIRSALSR